MNCFVTVRRSAAPDERPRSGEQIGNEEFASQKETQTCHESKNGNLFASKFSKSLFILVHFYFESKLLHSYLVFQQ
jgi:hypothetical protein